MHPRLRQALLELGDPLHLAARRIAVPAIVLLAPEIHEAARHAATPDELLHPPAGLGPILASLRSERLAASAHAILVAACALTCIGLRARAAAAVAALAALYLLGLPQLDGVPQHNHHLVWLLALLAASPCADALSIDARRRPPAGPSLAAGLAVLFAWALLLEVYFFPGVWSSSAPTPDSRWASGHGRFLRRPHRCPSA